MPLKWRNGGIRVDLQRLFYPESIAVVGASAKLGGGKLPYFHILKYVGYKGRLYPVNPKYDEMDGIKYYRSVDDLPEGIDLAIVTAPANASLEITKAAVRKKIKFIHFFTAGFSEGGNGELETQLLEEVKKSGTKIVGPNCIGVYCPEGGVSFGFRKQEAGMASDVAFFGQSGGVTTNFVRSAVAQKIGLNKVISFGNQIDIRAEDYLEYFAADEKVLVIAGYVEDLKDGRYFLDTLKRASQTKPVVLLKGGITDAGSRAAASHTGAMAGDYLVWASAVSQHGAIVVDNFEQMMDVVMLCASGHRPRGPRTGFLCAGGGMAVTFTDLAELDGLGVPELKRETQESIAEKISDVNTSTTNPVDLGMFGFDFNIVAHCIDALNRDENVDVIIPYFSVDFINTFQKAQIESGPSIIIEAVRRASKPVIPIVSLYSVDNIEMEETKLAMFLAFRKAGLPVYATTQDCIHAISLYLRWLKKHPPRVGRG